MTWESPARTPTSPPTCWTPESDWLACLRLTSDKEASLEELGQLADPQMTKDAVAGRIRRLLAMADKRAGDLGIAGTDANLTPDMLDA